MIGIYREIYKKPLTTVLHVMIGTAAKCWEENHVEKMEELKELRERTADYDALKVSPGSLSAKIRSTAPTGKEKRAVENIFSKGLDKRLGSVLLNAPSAWQNKST